MSLAKIAFINSARLSGLFCRAILTLNELDLEPNVSGLEELLSSALDAHDLRRRLAATLAQTIQIVYTGEEQASSLTSLNPLDVIQTANLSQLARIEHQLSQLASDKLLALIKRPMLDDPLLFPHLSALVGSRSSLFDAAPKLLGPKRAALVYCLYLARLKKTRLDPLGLLPGGTKWNWTDRSSHSTAAESLDRFERKSNQAAVNLHHLYHLDSIYRMLVSDNSSAQGHATHDEDEEEESEITKSVKQLILYPSQSTSGQALVRGSPKTGADASESSQRAVISDLMSTISAFDVMFCYLKKSKHKPSDTLNNDAFEDRPYTTSNYNNVSTILATIIDQCISFETFS